MNTALQASIAIDIRRNRANLYATQLIHELVQGGYIADRCRSEAMYHLAELFYRQEVEITTAEQRIVAASGAKWDSTP